MTEVADLRGDRLLVLYGELDIVTAPRLSALVDALRARRHAVALDLSEITFMDSTGLATLLAAGAELRRPSHAVRRVFELAGVARLLGDE
ncbi:MAG TPA: STAS domain-containing protein [Solirubrobacter sp.]|nr:STAS domain-containing protein [Solirubrobacter sp.]